MPRSGEGVTTALSVRPLAFAPFQGPARARASKESPFGLVFGSLREMRPIGQIIHIKRLEKSLNKVVQVYGL